MFNPGDKIRIVCEVVGTVKPDPSQSMFSIIADFNGELVRLPNDGHLLGLKCLKLLKVEDEHAKE